MTIIDILPPPNASRYGGGFQVCRLVGSRFFASESSPAPLRACPALLFYSFRAISITMDHQDVAIATHKKIDLVFHTQVFKLKRDMQKRSPDSASSSALRQNPVAEGIDETPAHSTTTVCGGPSRARTSAAGDQDHSRTPGGAKCK